jgi:xanthine dehydrogenase accessory factor
VAVAVERVALGPALGQCCGGAVTLLMAVCDAGRVAAMEGPRLVATGAGEMPLAVRRLLAAARGQGCGPRTGWSRAGWSSRWLEPERQVWVWGAGHVGRALVAVLAPLPGMA